MTTQTRTQERATREATGLVDAIAGLIDDVTEQLAAARARSGALEQRAADLGERMGEAREIAESRMTPSGQANEAVAAYHRAADARLALDGPRREAASQVIELMRRLVFLRSGREEWLKRADELEAGTVEPIAEPVADADVSPEPVVAAVAPSGSAGPEAAPALPDRPRSRWWPL